MERGVRGGMWIALYVALGLLPLTVAGIARAAAPPLGFGAELAVALGFVGYALLLLEVATVTRLRRLSDRFATDALHRFHRLMGIVALGFVVAHALLAGWPMASVALLNPFRGPPALQSGAAAFWATLLLVATALLRRRLRLSYEAWRHLHALLALLLPGALLIHLFTARGEPLPRALATVVIGFAAGSLALLLHYRIARPLALARRPWTLVENRDEGGDTRTLVLRPAGHAGFRFAPGQFAWLATGRHPLTSEQHPITIASSAERRDDGPLELSIKALGDWSRSVVPQLRPGARCFVDGPYGALTIDRFAAAAFVLIAGGIGVTPMRSTLLTMRDRGDRRPVVLFHAARNRQRMVFAEELVGLRRALDLRIVEVFEEPVASSAPLDGPPVEQGYVTAPLLRRHLPADLRHHAFLVCGPGPMQDAVAQALAELGVAPEQVHTERFDLP
ncbi:MAG: ferric reductase-like transmembrane domain-containing protein [Planctomycetes bacterium]|nr:ferric reductase-like transmembrane domain-containing protein [Planctomycetota bacterium]